MEKDITEIEGFLQHMPCPKSANLKEWVPLGEDLCHLLCCAQKFHDDGETPWRIIGINSRYIFLEWEYAIDVAKIFKGCVAAIIQQAFETGIEKGCYETERRIAENIGIRVA